MRRLTPIRSSGESLSEFLRLQKEGRGLDHLRAFLRAGDGPEEALRLLRRLRGIGRRPSAANGEAMTDSTSP